ncbi:hypothetical protein FB446DRAFT_806921 [Lentinula raphanica]|nr:hypothetical protein FB446DRAFT_806921 [Lentinula raphanica]
MVGPPFDLRQPFKSSFHLPRTLLLAVCFLNTFVVALSALELLELLLQKYTSKSPKEPIRLCLSFVGLELQPNPICTPSSPSTSWLPSGVPSISLGHAYFANKEHGEYIFNSLRHSLVPSEGQDERTPWEYVDGIMTFLSMSYSGLQNPVTVLTEETLKTWEGILLENTPTRLEVREYITSSKDQRSTGDLKVLVGEEAMMFHGSNMKSLKLKPRPSFSGVVVHFRNKAVMKKALSEIHELASKSNDEPPPWLVGLVAKGNSKKLPKYCVAWTRVNKFMELLSERDSGYVHHRSVKAITSSTLSEWEIVWKGGLESLVKSKKQMNDSRTRYYMKNRERILATKAAVDAARTADRRRRKGEATVHEWNSPVVLLKLNPSIRILLTIVTVSLGYFDYFVERFDPSQNLKICSHEVMTVPNWLQSTPHHIHRILNQRPLISLSDAQILKAALVVCCRMRSLYKFDRRRMHEQFSGYIHYKGVRAMILPTPEEWKIVWQGGLTYSIGEE